jgi:hypothetical protein
MSNVKDAFAGIKKMIVIGIIVILISLPIAIWCLWLYQQGETGWFFLGFCLNIVNAVFVIQKLPRDFRLFKYLKIFDKYSTKIELMVAEIGKLRVDGKIEEADIKEEKLNKMCGEVLEKLENPKIKIKDIL